MYEIVYIFIECLLSKSELKKLIKINTEDTFNSISIDSDTSTSDTIASVMLGIPGTAASQATIFSR